MIQIFRLSLWKFNYSVRIRGFNNSVKKTRNKKNLALIHPGPIDLKSASCLLMAILYIFYIQIKYKMKNEHKPRSNKKCKYTKS